MRPRRSSFSLHHEGCNRAQRVGAGVEADERLMSPAFEFAREFARAIDAEKRREGRLAGGLVLAGPLAHLLRRRLDIEEIVDDLKSESEGARVVAETGKLAIGGAAQARASDDRGMEERAGLLRVQDLQFIERERPAFALKIDHLPADHPGRTRGFGEISHRLQNHGTWNAVGCGGGEDLEGVGKEAVAAQRGHRLAEHLVAGGTAVPEVIVVHAGEVVVDERIVVNHLDGASKTHRPLRSAADRLARGERKDGAQALSAAEQTVAHRLEKTAVGSGRFGNHLGESAFNQRGALLQIAIELKHFPTGYSSAARVEEIPARAGRRRKTARSP